MNIKVENIGLSYGNHTALEDVTFELNEKKIYGLLGRNGAGKTTLLSILASFNQPSKGSVTIVGEDPFENASIMQQVAFLYDKSYKDETSHIINYLKDIQRYRPNFDMNYAEYLVGKFRLEKKKPIKHFSKGMQSALNVIIGLASRTPVTIFDEVYLGMDAPSRDIFYKELLKDQQDHPRIIILSTHLVSEMDYLFDEVILLNKGRILLQEEFHSLMSKGAAITGSAETVDDFVRSMNQINEKQLGSTKSVTIYGELHDDKKQAAVDKGLEVAPISLHDLFVHLTEEENE
ncbi:ATP-binding cassette domain-containing protein [Ornithinibacillus sp. L9]|uniref:ATP-binding cassette domain-containing protein n=1 Tax=Ornithinibacillus caprae TaxID=2678566 RepID=A0A6N8FFD1_9BACI|nr:ABC transporter ATP-binding protein [Ornithinibacillus caprae]MUK88223.1 ATP-binding cassette domain-containing protein [Ornithinibacillus caprae]